jgi:hypothetical protein
MTNSTTAKLFDLLREGTVSRCVAIVTHESPNSDWMKGLCETAKLYFKSVFIEQLGGGNLRSFLGGSSDLLLIYGLENCDPHSAEAYSVRSSLDVQGDSGIASVICLNEEAYQKHFCDKASPFYKFCGIVDQDSLRDMDTETR